MRIGVVITMYDEFNIVLNSIKNIKNNFPDSVIVVSQSEFNFDSEIGLMSNE